MKSLAGKLNCRIEVWGKVKEKTDLGTTYEEKLIKKVWANIQPRSGKISKGDSNTEFNSVNFLIRIRKTEIDGESNYIMYKGQRYDIEYIYPDFKNDSFLDVFTSLRRE